MANRIKADNRGRTSCSTALSGNYLGMSLISITLLEYDEGVKARTADAIKHKGNSLLCQVPSQCLVEG